MNILVLFFDPFLLLIFVVVLATRPARNSIKYLVILSLAVPLLSFFLNPIKDTFAYQMLAMIIVTHAAALYGAHWFNGLVIERAHAKLRDAQRNEPDYKAKKIISYSPEAQVAWNSIQDLPEKFKNMFLQELQENPTQEAYELAEAIRLMLANELRPYADDAANNALEKARKINAKAEEEFKEVYSILGKKSDLDYIISKIKKKHCRSEKSNDTHEERLSKDPEHLKQTSSKYILERARKRFPM